MLIRVRAGRPQAATQSAAAFPEVHSKSTAIAAHEPGNTADGNAGDALEIAGDDASQSREAQAATTSQSSSKAALPSSAGQGKAVSVSPSVTGRSQRKPFREPSSPACLFQVEAQLKRQLQLPLAPVHSSLSMRLPMLAAAAAAALQVAAAAQ